MADGDYAVSEDERQEVSRLCGAMGVTQAARRLKLNVASLLRVVAGQPVRRGTVALLRQALGKLDPVRDR